MEKSVNTTCQSDKELATDFSMVRSPHLLTRTRRVSFDSP